jgi:hypothetical protein
MPETKMREAACACGQLKLRCEGDPEYVSSCACQACQRRTGAPLAVNAIFLEEQVVARTGETRRFRRIAESGAPVDYDFCPSCGSTVSWRAASRPGKVMVAAGAFADASFPAPQRLIWAEHKPDWVRPPEGVPVYPKAP